MQGDPTVEQRREQVAAARAALTGLGDWAWQVGGGGGGGGLADLLGEVDALGAACEAAKVAIIGEAMERCETSGGAAALTITQWVRCHAPSTRSGGAGALVAVAQALGKPVNAPVRAAVEAGVLPVRPAASGVVAEADRLRPLLADGAEALVVRGLIPLAVEDGPRACRRLRPALLARYGRDGQLQLEQDAARRFVALSQPVEDGTGVVEYRL